MPSCADGAVPGGAGGPLSIASARRASRGGSAGGAPGEPPLLDRLAERRLPDRRLGRQDERRRRGGRRARRLACVRRRREIGRARPLHEPLREGGPRPALDRALRAKGELGDVERLRDEVDRPERASLAPNGLRQVGREDHEGDRVEDPLLGELRHELETVHLRELDIADDEVEALLVEPHHGLIGGERRPRLHAHLL